MQNNLRPWIQLNMIPGVGPLRFYTLLRYFGSPERVLSASQKELSNIKGIGEIIAKQIIENKETIKVDEELEKIEKQEVTVLTLQSEDYPKNLLSIFDPPPVLYVKGRLKPEDRFAIGMVGSRTASTYGRTITKQLCTQLVANGITIISGLARGIDTSVHQAVLEANGRTVAVMGCGLDVIYPPENKDLWMQIINHGAVISEFPFGTSPERFNFPQRNRLISGLSFGVVVVEAPIKSGSLITADLALEQGRDVFAVPGPINSRLSAGTNNLIKQGAKLIETADDILEEFDLVIEALKISPPEPEAASDNKHPIPIMSKEEEMIYQLLTDEPQHIDYICYLAKMGVVPIVAISQIISILIQLEIKGLVTQRRGKMFLRASN